MPEARESIVSKSKSFIRSLLPRVSTISQGYNNLDEDPATVVSKKRKNEIDAFIKKTLQKDSANLPPGVIDQKLAKILFELGQNEHHYRVLDMNLNTVFVSNYLVRVAPEKPVEKGIVSDDDEDSSVEAGALGERFGEEGAESESGVEASESEEGAEEESDAERSEDSTDIAMIEEISKDPWAMALLRAPASSHRALLAVNKKTLAYVTSSVFLQARYETGCWQQEVIVVYGAAGTTESLGSDCRCLSQNSTGWSHRSLAPLPSSISTGFAPTELLQDELFVVGGTTDEHLINDVLAYNASKDTWQVATTLPEERHFGVCGVIKKTLVIAGGQLGKSTSATPSVVAFDTGAKSWSTLPDMPIAVSFAQAGVIDNHMYVAGGQGENGPEGRLAVYDSESKVWEMRKDMIEPRKNGAAAIFGGKFIVMGGYSPDTHPVNSTFIYDPRRDMWNEGPSLPEPCANCHATALGGFILLVRSSESPEKPALPPFLLKADGSSWSNLDLLPREGPIITVAMMCDF